MSGDLILVSLHHWSSENVGGESADADQPLIRMDPPSPEATVCRDDVPALNLSLTPRIDLWNASTRLFAPVSSRTDIRTALDRAQAEQDVVRAWNRGSEADRERLRGPYLSVRVSQKLAQKDIDGAFELIRTEKAQHLSTPGLASLEHFVQGIVSRVRVNYSAQILHAALMQNMDHEVTRTAIEMPDVSPIQHLVENFRESVTSGRVTLDQAIAHLPPATRDIIDRMGMRGSLEAVQNGTTVREIEGAVSSLAWRQIHDRQNFMAATLLVEGLKNGLTVDHTRMAAIVKRLPVMRTVQANERARDLTNINNVNRIVQSLPNMMLAAGIGYVASLATGGILIAALGEESLLAGFGAGAANSVATSAALPVLNHGLGLTAAKFNQEFRTNLELTAFLAAPHGIAGAVGMGEVSAAAFNRMVSIGGMAAFDAENDGLDIPSEERIFNAMFNDSVARVGFVNPETAGHGVESVESLVTSMRETTQRGDPSSGNSVSPLEALSLGSALLTGCSGEGMAHDVVMSGVVVFILGVMANQIGLIQILRSRWANRDLGGSRPSETETAAKIGSAEVVTQPKASAEFEWLLTYWRESPRYRILDENRLAKLTPALITEGLTSRDPYVVQASLTMLNHVHEVCPKGFLDLEVRYLLRQTRGEYGAALHSAVDEFNRRQNDPTLREQFWSHEVPKLILESAFDFTEGEIADALQVVRERLQISGESADRATDIQLMAKMRALHPDLVSSSDIELALSRADGDLVEPRERWKALTALGGVISESQLRPYVTALLRSPVNTGAIYELLTGRELGGWGRTHSGFIGNPSLGRFHQWVGLTLRNGSLLGENRLRDASIAGTTELAAALSPYFTGIGQSSLTKPEPLLRGGGTLVSLHQFDEIATSDLDIGVTLSLDSNATAEIDPATRRVIRVIGLQDTIGLERVFDFIWHHPLENLLEGAGVEGVVLTGYDGDPDVEQPGRLSIPIDSLNEAIANGRLVLTVDETGTITIVVNSDTPQSHTP